MYIFRYLLPIVESYERALMAVKADRDPCFAARLEVDRL